MNKIIFSDGIGNTLDSYKTKNKSLDNNNKADNKFFI